ncbi:hypothetical protein [Helicobacter bilis]|uniref:Uncharacterized protein n=1 Tax=Helicobacter bilis TaxID=37372 RepID=A0A4U8UDI8_9HELI|nr:hypothetical protein [Helicobacter bilis]TLE09374.1 hypothetical protein LS78_002925 [Helicobacter bilis]TLE11431.1 hypothetical protein LS79_003130 [Helicobacter bilis]
MIAKDDTTYANIVGNKVVWIFTKNDMPEWNENDLHVVSIPKKLINKVKIGTEYINNDFVIKKEIATKDNVLYGVLGENNELLYSFTKEQKEFYNDDEKVVVIPTNQSFEVCNGNIYDENTESFVLDLEYVRNLYINLANESYNAVINIIMGENTPLSEMISWETQEKEAKAYLANNDVAQAPNIVIMATTQGRDISEFANKIIEKAQKYRMASSFLIGYRQKVIKTLESASDVISLRNAKFDKDFALQHLQSMSSTQATQG